jgi:hypothetical protein
VQIVQCTQPQVPGKTDMVISAGMYSLRTGRTLLLPPCRCALGSTTDGTPLGVPQGLLMYVYVVSGGGSGVYHEGV